MAEYISPAWQINIGSYTLQKLIRFDVISSRKAPIDLAEVELPLNLLPPDLAAGTRVVINQGYREKGLWLIFDGEIDRAVPKALTTVLYAQNGAQLKKADFTQTMIKAQPKAIVQQVLKIAGVSSYKLSSKALSPKDSFIPRGKCLDALRQVNAAWNLDDWAYYFEPEGTFYWGPWEESARYHQTQITKLEYGVNILEPTEVYNGGTEGIVTTFAFPWLRHSQKITLADPRHFTAPVEVRIERCHYHHDAQKARLTLEWSQKAS